MQISGYVPTALAALALVLLAGCGGGTSDEPASTAPSPTAVSPVQLKQAQHAVERVASRAVNRVHLKGPKKVRAKCKPDGQTRVGCNAVAYARPQAIYDSPTAPYSVAIADENWGVRVHGKTLGRNGLEQIIEVTLTDDEKAALEKSADSVREMIALLA